MDLLKDLKMSLLNFRIDIIYINHKISVLIKNHWNYLNDNVFKCFFKKYNRLLSFFKENKFFDNI